MKPNQLILIESLLNLREQGFIEEQYDYLQWAFMDRYYHDFFENVGGLN